MTVRIKNAQGKRESVECLDFDCPTRECFSPGYYQHRSCNNAHDSGCDDYLSCMYRNYNGCPETIHDPSVPIGKELEALIRKEGGAK